MAKIAKYEWIIRDIQERIESGMLQPNDQIETEEQLAERFGVSRVTVRRAISQLTEEGYLNKIPGKGTFIKNAVVRKQLNDIVSFSASSLMRGEMPSTQLYQLSETKPTPYVMKMLGISADTDIWEIRRLRLTNDYPVIYEESYWIKSVVGEITPEEASTSVFETLKDRIHMSYAISDYDAIPASKNIAEKLKVEEGFSLLRAVTVFYTQDDKPFEIAINYHRTDRMKLRLLRDIRG